MRSSSLSGLTKTLLGAAILCGVLASSAQAANWSVSGQYAGGYIYAPGYTYYAQPTAYHYPQYRYPAGYNYNGGYRLNSTAYVQTRLINLGYWVGPSGVTGAMNSETIAAIKQFQRDSKLEADGVVGKNTLKALDKRSVQAMN
jgi:Putative peptidoglycan binding domain